MIKWIRWWGLGVFLILGIVIAGLWLFFVDGYVKRLIEQQGTEVVGAKVELDNADVSLVPAGLTLTHFQVTDPDAPLTNAVEVARIAMGLDGIHLLWRKVIIEEMAIEGVTFGTQRATSGALRPSEELQQARKGEADPFSISLPSLEVPDVREILEKENLETVKLIDTLRADIQREKDEWEQRLSELPGTAQLAKYEERIQQIKESTKGSIGGILGGVDELQSLKKDIEQDMQEIKTARKQFKKKVALLKTRLAQIKTAPHRDVLRLKDKYNLSPQGLATVSQSLLGAHIGSWVHEAVAWYERVQPFLEHVPTQRAKGESPGDKAPLRGQGVDVRFQEFQPLPDFLIRLANVSLKLEVGDILGTIHNMTPDQAILGQPLTFAFAGEHLKGMDSLTFQGTMDHRLPTNTKDDVQWQALGYRLQSIALSKNAKWPVSIQSGAVDVNGKAELQNEGLSAHGTGQLSSLNVSAGVAGDTNPFTQSLSSAISDISTLSVQADVSGTFEDYEVRLRSDLDKILQDAAGKMVKDVADRFGKELQDAISAKIAEPMEDLNEGLGGFGSIGRDLAKRMTQENDLLKGLVEKGITKEGLPGGLKLPF